MDIESCRAEFPITNECAFLDNAAVAPISARAARYMREYIDDASRIARPACQKWAKTAARTRALAARIMGCRAREVAFTSSTSMGLALIASSLDWRVGDSVVTAANEFPSNMYPWLNLKRRGVRTRVVEPTPDGRILIEDLLSAFDSRTRVCAVSWVGFNTGFRIDLARLGRECKQRGVHLVVDAIQGLGAFAMKANEWGVAAAAADAHKWLLGPEGIALLYVSERIVDSLHPATIGWKSVAKSHDFMHYDFTLAADARRFEPGSENTAGVHGLLGALELFETIGVTSVTERVKLLTDYLCDGLRAKDITTLSPRGGDEWSGIVSFTAPGGDGAAFAKPLEEKGIIVTGRAGFVRASPHCYNNEADLDRLLEEL
jgi:cysteine desulfurase/selenocysteine lyase